VAAKGEKRDMFEKEYKDYPLTVFGSKFIKR
jgi:hypothetical protein